MTAARNARKPTLSGGNKRDRTDDLFTAGGVLSQLSYSPNPDPVTITH